MTRARIHHGVARPRRIVAALSIMIAVASIACGSGLPSGFAETQVATGLNSPTAMAIAPDGRIFVCQQGGQLRVIKNGLLLSTPFVTVSTTANDEEGLVAIAFDPGFASNGFVYVTYTAALPAKHNRISRFTASGDTGMAGSETIIFDVDDNVAAFHLGGALAFGEDGKLYTTTGDSSSSALPPSMTSLHGKVLRLDRDGGIPTDNPFSGTATGKYRAIWCKGFRNPFTFAIQPVTGRMFINDVGGSLYEEINEGFAGADYGWPATEGPTANPAYRAPAHAYAHTLGHSVTGGAFYDPDASQFPAAYVGKYFFCDYADSWIRWIDPDSPGTATLFCTTTSSGPVDMDVGPDGSLYYLSRGQVTLDGGSGAGWDTGKVFKISFTGSQAPSISVQPVSQTVAAGGSVTFSVVASGAAPLAYQWQKDGASLGGATSASYMRAGISVSDNGTQYRCVVTNGAGSATSNAATLTVTTNSAPVPTISAPAAGAKYSAGSTISFAGTATDAEDGALPASAFTWKIDFHHDTHTHPGLAATSGVKSGTYVTPASGETADNVWYRVYLTVADGAGSSTTVYRDVLPNKASVTLATSPPGLEILLDGQTQTAPYTVTGVTGISRRISATVQQSFGGTTYRFVSWSDGGAADHAISTPSVATTYTATFEIVGAGTEQVIVNWGGDYVTYDNNLRGYLTREFPVDLDGGNNDARAYCSYSDTTPLVPLQDYAQRTSWKFYGGVLMLKHDGNFAYAWAEIWSNSKNNPSDQLYYGADANTDGYDFRFWKKEDFLNGGATGTVVFDDFSKLEVLDYQGGDGVIANNSGRVRFVVKDGGQFFISEDFGDSTTTSFSLDDPANKKWAPYNPSGPYRIQFAWASASFASRSFTDITAVGLYHSNDNSTSPTRKAGFTAARFRITAKVQPAGPPPPPPPNVKPGAPRNFRVTAKS